VPTAGKRGYSAPAWSGGSLPPPAALDIRASVGTSTSPTSTGTKAVTGVGFQPKVVLPFGAYLTSSTASAIASITLGAGVSGSNRAAIAVASNSGVTTSATHRRHDNAKVITDCYLGSTTHAADLSSMDSDGYTLNTNPANPVSEFIFNHICLGGADLEVSLTQHQMNGTNAAQSFAHGLSGAPTGVLFFSTLDGTVPPNTQTGIIASIGAWAGSNQFGAAICASNGATTTATSRMLATNAVSMVPFAGVNYRSMAVSSVTATVVNVIYPITTSTTQNYFWMLAIRGAKCQVGQFDCNGSTSPLTINTTGITPKLFLPVFINNGVDQAGTVNSSISFFLGASDGTNNVSCGITDLSGVPTTVAQRAQSSSALEEYDAGAAVLRFSGTAAFLGESVILTPTTIFNATFGQGAYLIIGS
jgi:hypothetical protein